MGQGSRLPRLPKLPMVGLNKCIIKLLLKGHKEIISRLGRYQTTIRMSLKETVLVTGAMKAGMNL